MSDSEGSSEGAPPGEEGDQFLVVTKRKRKQTTACDRCRQRKIRCDGTVPCSYCSSKDSVCTFTPQKRRGPVRKKPRGEEAPGGLNAKDGQLATSYTRNYYFEMFFQYVNPLFDIIEPYIADSTVPLSKPALFQHHMVLCFSARALGHASVASNLFSQARAYAADLFDDFSADTGAGYLLLALYYWGEDMKKAVHFCSIAYSVSQRGLPSTKTRKIEHYCKTCGIVDNPSRLSKRVEVFPVGCRTTQTPFDEIQKWANVMFGDVVHFSRRFPVHSEMMDMYCPLFYCERLPLEQRSDEYMTSAMAQKIMSAMQWGEELLIQRNASLKVGAEGYDEFHRLWVLYDLAIQGLRTLFCTCIGLEELGAKAAAEALDILQSIPANTLGFSFCFMVPAILSIVNFAFLFKRNPKGKDQSHKYFLMSAAEVVRPLREVFTGADKLFQLIMRLLKAPDTIPYLVARFDQDVVAAPWMPRYFRGEGEAPAPTRQPEGPAADAHIWTPGASAQAFAGEAARRAAAGYPMYSQPPSHSYTVFETGAAAAQWPAQQRPEAMFQRDAGLPGASVQQPPVEQMTDVQYPNYAQHAAWHAPMQGAPPEMRALSLDGGRPMPMDGRPMAMDPRMGLDARGMPSPSLTMKPAAAYYRPHQYEGGETYFQDGNGSGQPSTNGHG